MSRVVFVFYSYFILGVACPGALDFGELRDVTTNLEAFFVGVLIIRALLFGVYILGAPDCGKLPQNSVELRATIGYQDHDFVGYLKILLCRAS